MKNGVKPYDIYSSIYEQKNINQIKLMGKLIENIKFFKDNEFVGLSVEKDILNLYNCNSEDLEGMTDFLRGIQGVEVAFMIQEIDLHTYKINFRSRGKYVINDIAKLFNGGGHKLAAGATVKNLSFKKIENRIVSELIKKSEL